MHFLRWCLLWFLSNNILKWIPNFTLFKKCFAASLLFFFSLTLKFQLLALEKELYLETDLFPLTLSVVIFHRQVNWKLKRTSNLFTRDLSCVKRTGTVIFPCSFLRQDNFQHLFVHLIILLGPNHNVPYMARGFCLVLLQ